MRATWQLIVAWCQAQVAVASRDWSGLCQMFARSAVGADAWASTARRAFEAIPSKYVVRNIGDFRAGMLAYFGRPGVDPGHATTVSTKPGYVWSTDIKRKGKVDLVPISLIVNKWGLPLRGAITWTPSGAIPYQPVADGLHVIKVNGRTTLDRVEVIRQSGMSPDRFYRLNPKVGLRVKPGTPVRVPLTCTLITAGRDRH